MTHHYRGEGDASIFMSDGRRNMHVRHVEASSLFVQRAWYGVVVLCRVSRRGWERSRHSFTGHRGSLRRCEDHWYVFPPGGRTAVCAVVHSSFTTHDRCDFSSWMCRYILWLSHVCMLVFSLEWCCLLLIRKTFEQYVGRTMMTLNGN